MMTDKKIGAIIATSMCRIDSLFSLSLHSVLKQTVLPDCIVVVDDNNDEIVNREIETKIALIGDNRLHYIKNQNTRNMSGTGAWNTGLEFLKDKIGEDNYAAILDDDDSWDSEYIETLYKNIQSDSDAVFAFLHRSDCPTHSSFNIDDLTINNFLIGDPGIQGSNMCFKIRSVLSIGGFDEKLASCTDRDLMIRFLHQFGNKNIIIIPQKLVNHFAGTNTVTSNYEKKRAGLNYFYRKHLHLFDYQTLNKSLKRAENLFHFTDSEEIISIWKQSIHNQEIVIGVAMHNNASTIRRCLSSILKQENINRKLHVVLANDNSTDSWQSEIEDLLIDERITILTLQNNNVVKTRNDINRFILENIPNCVLIGRLDADDEYSSWQELSKIENVFDTHHPDVISAGNYLRENEVIIERTNIADKRLADIGYVLLRLEQMSKCLPEGELPSCNLFIRPYKLLPYPSTDSGEDHALFVGYLMNQDKYSIFFVEDLLPVIYNLGGSTTVQNRFSGNYIRCRKELYLKTLELCKTSKE